MSAFILALSMMLNVPRPSQREVSQVREVIGRDAGPWFPL